MGKKVTGFSVDDDRWKHFGIFTLKFLSYTGLPVLLLCLILFAWHRSLSDPLTLLALASLSASFMGSVLILKKDVIRQWWLSGYPEGSLSQKTAKSPTKHSKGSLKERFKRWWKEGYNDSSELGTLERKRKAVRSRKRPLETQKHKTKPLEPTPEKQFPSKKARGSSVKVPSQEDFYMLKKALGIEKGALQHKKKGDGIYLVTYNKEKKGYDWKRLGTWSELRKHLAQPIIS